MVQLVTYEGGGDQYGVSRPLEGFHGPSDLGSAQVFSPGNAQLRPVLVARVQGQEKTRYSDFPAARGHTSLSFVLCKVQIELFIIKRTNSTSSV